VEDWLLVQTYVFSAFASVNNVSVYAAVFVVHFTFLMLTYLGTYRTVVSNAFAWCIDSSLQLMQQFFGGELRVIARKFGMGAFSS